ncbi:MAG: inosine/xanthosine triphosphatase [Prolixibacteraceae bacterium]|jgi:inosine/xanthosine triphosphatase|nr:inosine/xanthosine triphosphatase [Prolixibacteraceae bacterium]MBT6004076.1 inosine/xanthosine triphosphatase [Prolixibacteraceae bacterium]MBT6765839.1 inosine/xanthosine triphosphatase [Prolixibacteraceae bacterium]MBT6999950.1 inosine/xanthosine triphosphatase [Prolixibacteraceae bacterium]MBT7394149.1 inosine/xanthosine triphosphatase [Prolixibacteraceae bacterium]
MKVIVGSKNPVKKESVLVGFKSFFNSVEVKGFYSGSGVADQPLSDKETLSGARNRAENVKNNYRDADFWVGIEGGIETTDKGLTAFAWVVILSAVKYGEARTASFLLPLTVAALVQQGYELGIANDIVFNKTNSKQKNGAVGILTQNIVSRTELYKQAVQLALIPFINPDFF